MGALKPLMPSNTNSLKNKACYSDFNKLVCYLSSMTAPIFLSAWTVNSANRVRMTNSPGRMSVSMLKLEGKRDLSLGAPHGRTWVPDEAIV